MGHLRTMPNWKLKPSKPALFLISTVMTTHHLQILKRRRGGPLPQHYFKIVEISILKKKRKHYQLIFDKYLFQHNSCCSLFHFTDRHSSANQKTSTIEIGTLRNEFKSCRRFLFSFLIQAVSYDKQQKMNRDSTCLTSDHTRIYFELCPLEMPDTR